MNSADLSLSSTSTFKEEPAISSQQNLDATLSTEVTSSYAAQEEASTSSLAANLPFYYKMCITVLGVLGNSTTVFVMRRTKTPITSRIIIISLAVSDCSYLIFSLPEFVIPLSLGKSFALLSLTACKFHIFVIFFFQALSYWLVAILTVERFVAVVFPLKSKIILTKNKVLILLSVLIFVYFAWSVFVAFDYKIFYVEDDAGNLVPGECTGDRFYHIFKATAVFVDLGIPLVLIVVGNISICIVLLIHRRIQQFTGISQGQENKLFLTTFSVSLAFVVFNTPFTLYFTLGRQILDKTVFTNWLNPYFLVSDCLAFTNFGINFFLYIAVTQSFRNEIRKICRKCRWFEVSAENSLETRLSNVSSVHTKTDPSCSGI